MNIKQVFQALDELFQSIHQLGGKPYLVGGCVRDTLLQEKGWSVSFKDIDIEVHYLELDLLIQVLGEYTSRIDEVGKSFGVIKVMLPQFHDQFPNMEALDFTLPRSETKSGAGYTGFDISVNPYLGLKEAASRRDYTINSMYMDIEGIRDPYEGRADLDLRLLRAVSPKFSEDPLRVLRGMRQASQFNLDVVPETAQLCRELKEEYRFLAQERIWGEWWKWASKTPFPSKGLKFLQEAGWISFYPELEALIGTPQDPIWHPEGDVMTHTALVCDAAARIALRDGLASFERGVLVMAALCHDLAKPFCTEIQPDGRITSRGHEKAGEEPSVSLLNRMGYPQLKKGYGPVLEGLVPLVVNHLAHCSLGAEPTAKAVRKLSTKVNIEMLARLVEADHSGRPPLEPHLPEGMETILVMSKDLGVSQGEPDPLITGKILIHSGVQPGKEMGQLLKKAYEGQLEGHFDTVEAGLSWLGVI